MNMKPIVDSSLVAVGVLLSGSDAGMIARNDDLPAPDFPQPLIKPAWKSPDLFKQYLDNGQLEWLYQSSESYLREMPPEHEKNMSPDELKARLWISYHIAKAPLTPFGRDVWWGPDYEAKGKVVEYLTRMDRALVARKTGIPLKDLQLLSGNMCARIVNTLRRDYNPDLEKHQQELIARSRKEFSHDDVKWALFYGGLQNTKLRNDTAGRILTTAEKQFMNFLMDSYRDQADLIFHFIRKAGYPESSWGMLLDRTVGRNDSTRYLYSLLPESSFLLHPRVLSLSMPTWISAPVPPRCRATSATSTHFKKRTIPYICSTAASHKGSGSFLFKKQLTILTLMLCFIYGIERISSHDRSFMLLPDDRSGTG